MTRPVTGGGTSTAGTAGNTSGNTVGNTSAITGTGTGAPPGPRTPTGRRPPGPPGGARRAGALIAGAALAAAAVALQSAGLTSAETTAHLTWTGEVGQEIAASRFSAKVKAVHVAKAVEVPDPSGKPKRAGTSGIFLIAEVAATATRRPQKFGSPVLLSRDGRRYEATDKVDGSLTVTNPYIQVGWWVQSVAVFEIPATVLAGSRIVLAPRNGFIGEALLPEVEVDLDLDEAAARRLISNAKDVYPLASKR